MTMISIGGVIGAGLFVGTGPILNQAGPATVLTYLLTGTILVLIMRMLGEMAVAQPSVGSFSDYGRMALGNWAGFSIGWLYWYFWVIVVGVETVAGAGIINLFLPGIPPWLLCLILIMALTATNLYSVGSYGEFEFWFAGIKVVAIIAFIILAALFVIGLWPGGGQGNFAPLYSKGGFFPNGPLAMFAGIATVIFSFVGAEVVTIAAAESNEPEEGVARATNAVIWRVLLFYVVSLFFVASIVPWNSEFTAGTITSPFAVALEKMGIPYAPTVMNRGFDRRALRAQLQSLHHLPDALRPDQAQRRAAVFPANHQSRRADMGDPCRYLSRVRRRPDLVLLPGAGLRVASQRLGSDRALRLPARSDLGTCDAATPGA